MCEIFNSYNNSITNEFVENLWIKYIYFYNFDVDFEFKIDYNFS